MCCALGSLLKVENGVSVPFANLPIALFDSGVGGLTVLKAISQLLPNENLLYLGDTARVPYGTRSPETIIRYSLAAAGKLVSSGAKMLVIACNTATSAALELLKDKFSPMPVIGVIEPGAQAAVTATSNKTIAVIATEATINGGAYQKAISNLDKDVRVRGRACTLFVALAEEGWTQGDVAKAAAKRYLGDLFPPHGELQADTLLLGCTHFPLLSTTLHELLGDDVCIVDSAQATAVKVLEELKSRNALRSQELPPWRRFLITDNPERFMRTGTLFLGRKIEEEEVELVEL